MDPNVIRVLVALVFAGLLYWQSRKVAGRPNQRRAYLLSGLALLAVAALNTSLLTGAVVGVFQLAAGGVAFGLLIGAALFYLRAFQSGELRPDVERTAEMAREYRERRERERRERE
jgi:hypothetical protein